jgi:hypothetical protein
MENKLLNKKTLLILSQTKFPVNLVTFVEGASYIVDIFSRLAIVGVAAIYIVFDGSNIFFFYFLSLFGMT